MYTHTLPSANCLEFVESPPDAEIQRLVRIHDYLALGRHLELSKTLPHLTETFLAVPNMQEQETREAILYTPKNCTVLMAWGTTVVINLLNLLRTKSVMAGKDPSKEVSSALWALEVTYRQFWDDLEDGNVVQIKHWLVNNDNNFFDPESAKMLYDIYLNVNHIVSLWDIDRAGRKARNKTRQRCLSLDRAFPHLKSIPLFGDFLE